MGVTLGDSIIGLTALAAIKRRYPTLLFSIYRPHSVPRYVRQLYQLAEPVFGKVIDLPVHIESLPAGELQLDVGNHLFWPNFASMPMIDFFLWALGVSPSRVSTQEKSNDWLRCVKLPGPERHGLPQEYVLFCPSASTPVRSIPPSVQAELVERMWARFGLPVFGFGEVAHSRYTDITALSPDTPSFLAWVKGSQFVLTSDTAAVHVAAGFEVPTLAFFTTIAAQLRVRDYWRCTAIDLLVPELAGIHASGREQDLSLVEGAFHAFLTSERGLRDVG
jgi:hypothetical protein